MLLHRRPVTRNETPPVAHANACPMIFHVVPCARFGWRVPREIYTDGDPRDCAGFVGWAAGARSDGDSLRIIGSDLFKGHCGEPMLHLCKWRECGYNMCCAHYGEPTEGYPQTTFPCTCWCYLRAAPTARKMAREEARRHALLMERVNERRAEWKAQYRQQRMQKKYGANQ